MLTEDEMLRVINGEYFELHVEKGYPLPMSRESFAAGLDAVFEEAWQSTSEFAKKADLIDKFEAHYSEYREYSEWYKCIEASIAATRRLANQERRPVLEELKVSIVDTAFDWRDLAAQFRAISAQFNLLEAPDDVWNLVGAGDSVKADYEALARRAAVALGYAGGPEGLRAWYTLLKRDSPRYRHPYIKNISEASAEFCVELETRAMEEKAQKYAAAATIPAKPMVEVKVPGPKGPRPATLQRCKLIGASGLTGRELCDYLTRCRTPLPSKKLKSIHGHDWVAWFNTDSPAVYKQFSRDQKAFRNLE
jgi:hypothetical protein